MTDQSATPNEKRKLPVQWVDEEGFEVTPSAPLRTDTRLLVKPLPGPRDGFTPPPLQTP